MGSTSRASTGAGPQATGGVAGSTSPSGGLESSTGEETSSSSSSADASSSTGSDAPGMELLVCSFSGDSVSRFDLTTGSFLGELGPTRELDGALGIVVGPDGSIYVASEESNAVLRFDGPTGMFVDRFVADDPKTREDETGGLDGPGAVLFDRTGRLLVSSFDSDAVLRYDPDGAFIDVFVESQAGGLDGPDAGMALGPDGDLYVPGYYSNTVSRFDGRTGAYLSDFTPTEMLAQPRTVLFHDDALYVSNEGSSEVLRFDATTGDFVDVFIPAGSGGLAAPAGMVFDPDGVLHVVSVSANTVLRFDGATGAPLPTLIDGPSAGLSAPTHLALHTPT